MKISSNCSRCNPGLDRRTGLFAASETAIMVFALASGFWLINQFHNEVAMVSDWTAKVAKACSERAVYRICLDPHGNSLWVHRRGNSLSQLDLATGRIEKTMPIEGLEALYAAMSDDGSTCLLCCADGTVLLVRDGEEQRVHQIAVPKDSFHDATLSRDGHVCLCVSAEGHAFGWNRDSAGDHELKYDFPRGSKIERIGLNSSGNLLCVARCDASISFHNPLTGTSEGRTLLADSVCVSLAWSYDERFLVVASTNGLVRTYELATGRIVFESSGVTNAPFGVVSTVAISANGQRIAVTNIHSNEITVWDVQSGKLAARLQGHDGLTRSLQFSPQTNRLYSGSYDGTIREWDVEKGALLRIVD